jgi:hypothetical protein
MSGDETHILEEALADLLGFEDGASDILDHLLIIESREVSDFLTLLLVICLVLSIVLVA